MSEELGKDDPCAPFMDSYLKCVESHKEGLSEGDDCQSEVLVYKKCRADEQKEKRKKKKQQQQLQK
jgi:hypothetical protein